MPPKKETQEDIQLPSAEEAAPAPQQDVPAPDQESPSKPFWRVSANGLSSESFHADDESDAIRQFFIHHGIKETDKHQARVERVS